MSRGIHVTGAERLTGHLPDRCVSRTILMSGHLHVNFALVGDIYLLHLTCDSGQFTPLQPVGSVII